MNQVSRDTLLYYCITFSTGSLPAPNITGVPTEPRATLLHYIPVAGVALAEWPSQRAEKGIRCSMSSLFLW